MATILWQASSSLRTNFAAMLGVPNDKCYGAKCPCKRRGAVELLSQLHGVGGHSIDDEQYYDSDDNHYGSWQLHQLPLKRLRDVVAIHVYSMENGTQLKTLVESSPRQQRQLQYWVEIAVLPA